MRKNDIAAGSIYVDRHGHPALVLDTHTYATSHHTLVKADGPASYLLVAHSLNSGLDYEAQINDLRQIAEHTADIRSELLTHGGVAAANMIAERTGLRASAGAWGSTRKFVRQV